MKGIVLVTGGAGFIGSHLVEALVERGYHVRIIDNMSTGTEGNLRSVENDVEIIRSDLRDTETLRRALNGVDTVFHLADVSSVPQSNIHPSTTVDNNVGGIVSLLKALNGSEVERVVYTSSSTVYGDAKVPTREDHPLMPISVYGGTKAASEALLTSHAHILGFDLTILRLANIVGPRNRKGLIWDLVRFLRSGTDVVVLKGDGRQRKSYLHVHDCVKALIRFSGLGGISVINVGATDSASVREVAHAILDRFGFDGEVLFDGGVDGGRGWRGDVKTMMLDISKAMALGWRPTMSSLEAAVRAAEETWMELEVSARKG